ncbi:MAG: hypothetical protein BGN83_16140 [Rhizobium sp. 63-7]|nr:MAG: hypothetical protein BGN83_16140 [Rhizobium sp. 63-7]
MLHAGDDLLPDITSLPERQAAVEIDQRIVRKGILQGKIAARMGDAGADAQGVVGLRPAIAMLARLPRQRQAGPGESSVDDAAAFAVPENGDAVFGFGGNLDRGAQLVHGEPFQQAVPLGGIGFEQETAGITPDQEIEEDLALRRQQRPRPGFAFRQSLDVGGDQAVKESFRVAAADPDQRTFRQIGMCHCLGPFRFVR